MLIQCKQCGYNFQVQNTTHLFHECPTCKTFNQFDDPLKQLPPSTPNPTNAKKDAANFSNDPNSVPWEFASEGYVKAFFSTIKKIFLEPVNFFENLSPLGGFPKPIFFAQICYIILGLFVLLTTKRFLTSFTSFLVVLLLVPILYLAHLYFSSFVIHFFLRLFKGEKYGYEATFRVFAYSQATLLIQIIPFHLIPFIGRIIGAAFTFTYLIIGLNKVQKSNAGQIAGALISSMAVLFSIVLIFTLIFAGFFALLIGAKTGKI